MRISSRKAQKWLSVWESNPGLPRSIWTTKRLWQAGILTIILTEIYIHISKTFISRGLNYFWISKWTLSEFSTRYCMLSRKIVKCLRSLGLTASAEAVSALISVLSRFTIYLASYFIWCHLLCVASEEDVDGSLNLIVSELKERIQKREGTIIIYSNSWLLINIDIFSKKYVMQLWTLALLLQ